MKISIDLEISDTVISQSVARSGQEFIDSKDFREQLRPLITSTVKAKIPTLDFDKLVADHVAEGGIEAYLSSITGQRFLREAVGAALQRVYADLVAERAVALIDEDMVKKELISIRTSNKIMEAAISTVVDKRMAEVTTPKIVEEIDRQSAHLIPGIVAKKLPGWIKDAVKEMLRFCRIYEAAKGKPS
jgi:hypothetical protein